MKNNTSMQDKIKKILIDGDYGVDCLGVYTNVQGTHDVMLSNNIYYKEHEKMENAIRELDNINDIMFQSIA